MDTINKGWTRTTRRVAIGFVSIMVATLLAGGTAKAEPRGTWEFSAQQASHAVASSYFGEARTSVGYIPGL
jgi:hypothetical protein